nr:hypothetical protein CFP56_12112 [Quercus suber]
MALRTQFSSTGNLTNRKASQIAMALRTQFSSTGVKPPVDGMCLSCYILQTILWVVAVHLPHPRGMRGEAWLILYLVRLPSPYRLGQSPPDMVIITAIFRGEGVIGPYPCPPLYPSKHCLKCWRDTYHVREYARPVLEEWASYVALANIDSECAAGKAWLELYLALLPSLYRPGQSLPRYSVHDCSSRNEAAISPYPCPLLYSPNTALSGSGALVTFVSTRGTS